jgi:hypothetical protein
VPSPIPKPKEQRVNRSQKLRGEWVDLEPLNKPVLEISPVPEAADWHERTKRLWRAWRDDPVTSQWSQADIAAAIDVAIEYDHWVKRDKGYTQPAILSSIYRRQDRLGLTPGGKRDLRWRTPNEVETLKEAERKPAEVRRIRAV